MYRNKKRLSVFTVLIPLVMLILGFVIGKAIEDNDKVEKAAQTVNTVQAANENSIELKSHAKLIFRTSYSRCAHFKEKQENLPQELIGATEKKFKEQAKYDYPKWDIVKFTQDKVVFSKEKDTYCDDHYIVGQENGYIIIYKYEDGEKIIIRNTDIPIANLPQVDQEEIKDGELYNTLEEINKALEDYGS